MTGLADTQIELTRDRPAWFPPGKSLQLPHPLLEVRHRIVHRHLPSLAELKRAAKDSLDWLWEWYWSQLDHAFPLASNEKVDLEPDILVREKLQTMLKQYVKERKTEIKSRNKEGKAAEAALTSYTLRYGAPSTSSKSTAQAGCILFQLLLDEKMILPTDKKLGTTMTGAFLIWDAFLFALCKDTLSKHTLLTHILNAINAPPTSSMLINPTLDPDREGLYEWMLHLLCSGTWEQNTTPKLLEDVLGQLFSQPSFWNVKLAGALLDRQDVPNKKQWRDVLDAANKEGEDDSMEVIEEEGEPMRQEQETIQQKIRGPTRVIGLWKPKPIGWLPPGWEEIA